MELIARTLERDGFRTFLPHRDGLEHFVMRFAGAPKWPGPAMKRLDEFIGRAIFAVDIYWILERSAGLVFNMNGRVPDEGGVVETAVAFTAGVPLVIYERDDRAAFAGNDNAMLTGLTPGFSTVGSVSALPQAIRDAMAAGQSGEKVRPPQVARTLEFGRRVWQVLEKLNRLAPAPQVTSDLLEQLEKLQLEMG